MENDHKQPVKAFFSALTVCMIVTCFKTNVAALSIYEIVKTLFVSMNYYFIAGVWYGLGAMFATCLYLYLKKSLNHEQRWR